MIYRIEIKVSGVLRVEAESPEEAERMARSAIPTMHGKHLFGPKVEAKCVGKVEDHNLTPNGVTQVMRNKLH